MTGNRCSRQGVFDEFRLISAVVNDDAARRTSQEAEKDDEIISQRRREFGLLSKTAIRLNEQQLQERISFIISFIAEAERQKCRTFRLTDASKEAYDSALKRKTPSLYALACRET